MGTVVHAPTVWGSYYAFTRVRVGPEGVRWPQSAQRATRCGETDASSVCLKRQLRIGGVGTRLSLHRARRCTVLQFSSLVSGSFVNGGVSSELNRSGVCRRVQHAAPRARVPSPSRAVVAVPRLRARARRPARSGRRTLRGSTSTTPGGGEPAIANRHRRSGADARRTAPSASRALSAVSTTAPAPEPRESDRTSRSRGACVRRTRVSVPSRAGCDAATTGHRHAPDRERHLASTSREGNVGNGPRSTAHSGDSAPRSTVNFYRLDAIVTSYLSLQESAH